MPHHNNQSDILDDSQRRPYLTAAELRAVRIPEARRHGLDSEITAEVLERAALTIDSLHNSIDGLNSERDDQIQAADDIAAQVNESEPAAATRLLAAAQATADALIASARSEADGLLAAAQSAVAAARDANARIIEQLTTDTETQRQALLDDLRTLRTRVASERDELQATLAAWSGALSEKRQRVLDTLSDVLSDVTAALTTATTAAQSDLEGVPSSDIVADPPASALTPDEELAALDPEGPSASSAPTPSGPVPRVTSEDIVNPENAS